MPPSNFDTLAKGFLGAGAVSGVPSVVSFTSHFTAITESSVHILTAFGQLIVVFVALLTILKKSRARPVPEVLPEAVPVPPRNPLPEEFKNGTV